MSSASNAGMAPFNSPTSSYTCDGVRKGMLDVLGATGAAIP